MQKVSTPHPRLQIKSLEPTFKLLHAYKKPARTHTCTHAWDMTERTAVKKTKKNKTHTTYTQSGANTRVQTRRDLQATRREKNQQERVGSQGEGAALISYLGSC